jgi:hypothetical protein
MGKKGAALSLESTKGIRSVHVNGMCMSVCVLEDRQMEREGKESEEGV